MEDPRIGTASESDIRHSAGTGKSPRRSFLKVLGGLTIAAIAAVSNRGRGADGVLASHPPGSTGDGELHVGEANLAFRSTGLMQGPPSNDDGPTLAVVWSDNNGPNTGQYQGYLYDLQNHLGAPQALVGTNFDGGPGVVGDSHSEWNQPNSGAVGVFGRGHVGVEGEGGETGVSGSGDATGIHGQGNVGVVGLGGFDGAPEGGIGVLGISSDDEFLEDSLRYDEFAIDYGAGVVHTSPVFGIGMRAQGDTGVEGISQSESGYGVVGHGFGQGGTGVVGTSSGGGIGVHGIGAIGIIGTALPDGQDGVVGEGPVGIHGKSSSPDGAGVRGEANGGGDGVLGQGKTGIHGESTDEEDGEGVRGEGKTGVHGRSDKAQGKGIHGEATDEEGEGVRGVGKTGVHGRSEKAQGKGIHGEATDEEGEGVRGVGKTGVHGRSEKAQGKGIHGEATDEEGEGVRGEGKTGVRGRSDKVQGKGIHGEATDEEGEGVRGEGKTGVHGKSEKAQGKGIHGEATNDGEGVRGDGKTGVRGNSSDENGFGVSGENENGVGIQGRGKVGIKGVASGPPGQQTSSNGGGVTLLNTVTQVQSLPDHPVAIQGIASGAGAVGVEAWSESDGATALKVETLTTQAVALEVKVPQGGTAIHIKGAACFDTVGMGIFSENSRSATVDDPRVTTDSFIYAMLTGNPSPGNGTIMVAVSWVERDPGVGFTVHLNTNVKLETPFSYFIVEPCPADHEDEVAVSV